MAIRVPHAASDLLGSYTGRSTLHLQTETPDWKPDTLLFYFWQVWHSHHTSGTGKVGQGFASETFASGFASYATMAIKHELWGTRLARPYNRRYVAAEMALSTMEEIEHEPRGVRHALLLLTTGDRKGWWSHRFGTAQRYPSDRPDDDGDGRPDHHAEVGIKYRLDGRVLPAEEPDHLTFWDVLTTFRANPKYDRDLSLGDGEHVLLRFIDRACDIHHVSDSTREMLLRSLDPLATQEPYEQLPEKP